jgi:putrescine transport system substrate-binding protein
MTKTWILATSLLAALAVTGPANAQQRQVNVYNWSDYMDEQVLKDFEKETGIKVRYDVFDSNDVLETKLLAGKTGYDIVVPTGAFLGRQIQAGVFQKLDKSKLPNLKNMWPDISARLAAYDPGNDYAINYMWGTTGIGYNINKIKERMPDAPLDSWRLALDPTIVSKFKDCGVMVLDAADEVIPAVLNYLGLDPNSMKEEDLNKAREHMKLVRPSIRKFHSSEYINALANGDVCLVVGWSGDVKQAQARAEEANAKKKDPSRHVLIDYVIPKEGALMWFDNMAIPSDAKNVAEAHEFLNYLMRADVAAKLTNYIQYPSGNLAAQEFVDKEILNNPKIYPPKEVVAKLFTNKVKNQAEQRLLTATWRDMKRGR